MPKKVKLIFLISIIMGSIGLLCLAADGYFLWYQKLSPLLEENKNKEAKLNEMNNKIQQIPILMAKLSQLRAKEKALKNLIPAADYKSKEKLIDAIKKMSSLFGLRIRDIKEEGTRSSSGTTIPAGVETIIIEFELVGSYFDVIKFVDLLEHSSRFFNIDHFEFSQGTKQQEITLKLTGYIDTTESFMTPTNLQYDQEKTNKPPR
ncbi:MAG: type 4a pilus biogenesis protein PilO [Planctomycetes bacterium]|nr:type 4a pilus biogenesis protein PilO [Planctomycetota bacterium]